MSGLAFSISSFFHTALFFFMTLFCCASVLADQLYMKNGDVLTGEILIKESAQLIFKTPYAGELKINWSDIESVQSDHPVTLVTLDGTKMEGQLQGLEDSQLSVTTSSQKNTQTGVNLDQVKYINPSPALTGEGYVWTGHINAGSTLTSGNSDTKNARVDGETIVRGLDERYTLGGFLFWAEDSGTRTASNSRLNGQYDWFITKKWYGYANSVLENDRFRDIKLRARLGTGTGYQLFDQPDFSLAIEGGINYIDQNYYQAEDEGFAALRWAIRLNKSLYDNAATFFHNHEVIYGLKSPEQILLFSETGLRFPLVFNLNGTALINYTWDSQPAEGRVKGDTRMVFTLGYNW